MSDKNASNENASNRHALLTSRQAAAELGVGERTLRDLRRRGLIAYVALTDRLIMYRPEDCADYLASRSRRNEPCSKPEPSGARPRATSRRRTGNVLPFEALAKTRGW